AQALAVVVPHFGALVRVAERAKLRSPPAPNVPGVAVGLLLAVPSCASCCPTSSIFPSSVPSAARQGDRRACRRASALPPPHPSSPREAATLPGARPLPTCNGGKVLRRRATSFDADDPIFRAGASSLNNIKYAVIGMSGSKALCWSKLSTAQLSAASPNTL